MELTDKEFEARLRVCLALDVPTVKESLDLAEELSDYIGLFKIGKQLHTIACNEGIPIAKEIYSKRAGFTGTCMDNMGNTFLDLKFHDTPNTVYEASKACAKEWGIYMFNVHISGGEKMCKKAVEGAKEGSMYNPTGCQIPKVIGVTVLTSLNDDDLAEQGLGIKYDDLVRRRTELAKKWGLDGVVCPANKAGELEKEFGKWLYVTPGIEWKGKQGEGQKQLYTPDKAVQDCKSSVLVIGSAIIKAQDKKATAYEILQAMAKYI